MTIFIGADHRGFELKNQLIEYIQEKNIRVEDLGAYEHDPQDDYPVFGKKVATAVLQNPEEFIGILICGSGAGVDMAANRFKGIRCGLGFDEKQVRHIRENDHANILAIPSDYVDFEKAKGFVDAFLDAEPKQDEKYLRRSHELDILEEKSTHQS